MIWLPSRWTGRATRFEWQDADQLVKVGEDVRWLPRQRAAAVILPVNARIFDRLQQSAVYGREARQVISRALRDLPGQAE